MMTVIIMMAAFLFWRGTMAAVLDKEIFQIKEELKMDKKSIFMVLIVFVLLTSFSQKAVALTISTGSNYGPYQAGGGGEFTWAPDSSLAWVLNNYDAKAKGFSNGLPGTAPFSTFQSFCIEKNEGFSLNTTYDVVLSDYANYGGVGGATNNKDPLSKGTAWLYSQFASGILSGYNYTGTESQREASAAALQNTIWWLENEISNLSNSNIFKQAVLNQFGSFTNAKSDNNGMFSVMALNLTDFAGGKHQDQLVATPEPAAALLLGLGFLGLFGMRRKFSSI